MLPKSLILAHIAACTADFATLFRDTNKCSPILEEARGERLMTCMLVVGLLVAITEAPADQAEVLRVRRSKVCLELKRLKRSDLLLTLKVLLRNLSSYFRLCSLAHFSRLLLPIL